MNWGRVILIWLVIVVAESIHGTLRQLFIIPLLGDLPSRQIGVFVGSIIIFVVTYSSIFWIDAKNFSEQLTVGAVWVILIMIFEFSLGTALGYSKERILSDYNIAEGGLMGFWLLFLLFAPALAARVRRVR